MSEEIKTSGATVEQVENARMLIRELAVWGLYSKEDADKGNALKAILAEREELLKDKVRLGAVNANSWDVRCFDVPTGGSDADVAWGVIEHHMAEPRERVIGRGLSASIAIDAAMKGEG